MLFTFVILSRHWDSSMANQVHVTDKYSYIVMHTKITLYSWLKMVLNTTKNPRNNSNVGIQGFCRHPSETKTIRLSSRFREMYTDSYITVLWVATSIFGETKWQVGQRSPQNTWLQVDYLCTDGFNSEILSHEFVIQCQTLINIIIFVVSVLNLLLNTKKKHIMGCSGPRRLGIANLCVEVCDIIDHNVLEYEIWFWLIN